MIFISLSMMVFLAACSMPLVSIEAATPTPAVTATPPVEVVSTLPALPSATAAPSGGQTDLGDMNVVSSELARAFEARDFAALRALMGERFSISTLDQSLYEYPSDEALDMLRQSVLVEGSAPAVRPGTDVVALLSGADPLDQWCPVAKVVRAVHVMGLGPAAGEEAVLVIGRDEAKGVFTWHGILLPGANGHFEARPVSDPLEVVDTEVQYVMVKEDINVRTGPGTEYALNGQIYGGQIAEVHGMSADRGWYRIFCTQDSTGYCWITADPALTEPASAP
jgi:hypothetical protein